MPNSPPQAGERWWVQRFDPDYEGGPDRLRGYVNIDPANPESWIEVIPAGSEAAEPWCSECDYEGGDHDPECSQPPYVASEHEAKLVGAAWRAAWKAAQHPANESKRVAALRDALADLVDAVVNHPATGVLVRESLQRAQVALHTEQAER